MTGPEASEDSEAPPPEGAAERGPGASTIGAAMGPGADGTTPGSTLTADHAGPDEASTEDLGWFVSNPIGRTLLSCIVIFLAVTLVIWNLPDSEVRSELRPVVRPVVNAVAIDQSWSVFAPNPTTVSLAVEADVYHRDGTVERYTFPHGDPVVGAYREYRWRKWERRIRLDRNDHLWEPTARWVADRYPDDSVTKVVLVRRFSDTPDPGSGDERTWDSVDFFTLDLEASAAGDEQ